MLQYIHKIRHNFLAQCKTCSSIRKVLSHSSLSMVFLFWIFMNTHTSIAQEYSTDYSELGGPLPHSFGWPIRVLSGARELSDCEGLGFHNASKNKCGYCTEGDTKLPKNYSLNCLKTCRKDVHVDCEGVCDGKDYIDECSGQCMGESKGNSNSNRDCRGLCSSTGLTLYMDNCGVCHTGTSPFEDCTNQCHLPGQEKLMANRLCGRCVGGMSGIPETEVLDDCGRCKSDGINCPCNGTGLPDVCGECNGGGRSCFRVTRFQPRALPMNTNAQIVIEGAFRNAENSNVMCVLLETYEDLDGNRTEIFGTTNGTQVTCTSTFKPGRYKVGVKLTIEEDPKEEFVEGANLVVYEEAEYYSMSPTTAVFDREGARELIVTFSGAKVPPLPLTCVITGEGWPADKRLAPSEANTLHTCIIPYPNSSMEITIAQSFNGIHLFKKSFQFQFFASPPDIKKSYIAEDGHAVMVVFDTPVELCKLDNCSQMLNSHTLKRLGDGAICQWATKQQLIITVQSPIKGNQCQITFKEGILKRDGQKFAHLKKEGLTTDAWFPQAGVSGQIAISGPSSVSYCGMFTLVGHFSSPKGDAQFYWTAYREESTLRAVEKPVADALLEMRTSSLTLDASLLEINMSYIFVLTAQHSDKEKYQAEHRVQCLHYIGPLVTAFSDVMTQASVSVDQKITLQAEVSLPDCSTTTEFMHLVWSASNPEVEFDFSNKNSQVYVIKPYSLPESTEVYFAAHAYFGNLINVTFSQIKLRVEPVNLRSGIKGVAKRTVSNKSGILVLESEPLNKGVRLIYQWRCTDQDRTICYNYRENSSEPLLLPVSQLQERSRSPKLTIPCENLKGGQTLTFELQVFNANNRYQYSSSASTVVIVKDQDLPQVFIESVLEDDLTPVTRHPTTGAYDVPAGLRVTIQAKITPGLSPVKSVKWDIKGFSSSYIETTKAGKSTLTLEEGFLVGHGIYLIGLSACDTNSSCGIANLTVHATPGVALCKLKTEPYTEYEMTNIKVIGCSVPIGRQPITYQLNAHSGGTVFPMTSPQTSTVFNIVGPPKQNFRGTEFSIEVCDKYSLCRLYPGPVTNVTINENREPERKKLLQKAALAVENRNLFPALSMYLTAAMDKEIRLSESEMAQMLNAGDKVTKNRYINAGQLSLIYSYALPLIRHGDNNAKLKALDLIKRATKLSFGYKVKVPNSILSQGYSNGAEALESKKVDPAVSDKVRKLSHFFVEKLSTTAPLGSRILLTSPNPGYPASLIFRKLPDRNPIYIKTMSRNGMVEGSVRFEEAAYQRIQNRKGCKKAKCEGIVVSMTLYPHDAPFTSALKRASPVLDVTLRKPEDGSRFTLADVTNAIKLSISHVGNATEAQEKGFEYKCAYYDHFQNEWSTEGVVTQGTDRDVMRCWSSHLSSFAVVEYYRGLSAASIVGIVVTGLMGVFIIMMFAFFFFRKKHAANARVSNEALQPKRPSEKLQGMNGSVVKVKTIDI